MAITAYSAGQGGSFLGDLREIPDTARKPRPPRNQKRVTNDRTREVQLVF